MIKKIISGGQTGVDQAALDVAKKLRITIGGFCPRGGLDENQQLLLNKYPLKETHSTNPAVRTKLNIKFSDATLILIPHSPLPDNIKDGTLLTMHEVKKRHKPFLIIDLSEECPTSLFQNWITQHQIEILNIAGPRESSWPGVKESAYRILQNLLRA